MKLTGKVTVCLKGETVPVYLNAYYSLEYDEPLEVFRIPAVDLPAGQYDVSLRYEMKGEVVEKKFPISSIGGHWVDVKFPVLRAR